jgi:tRNA A-37 threonylcarbamoyl transferase component Bud32
LVLWLSYAVYSKDKKGLRGVGLRPIGFEKRDLSINFIKVKPNFSLKRVFVKAKNGKLYLSHGWTKKNTPLALPGKEIGSGKVAKVFEVDVNTAYKSYKSGSNSKYLTNEVMALELLNKKAPGTVPKLISSNENGFAMERIGGNSLENYIKDADTLGIRPQQRLNLGFKVGEALKKIHSAGVFHGDLTENNVMISADGLVKFLDFEDSKILKPNSKSRFDYFDEDVSVLLGGIPGNNSSKRLFTDGFFKAYDIEPEFSFEPYRAINFSVTQYSKPKLRERLKNQIKNSSRGGKPGQWSAIKSNILAKKYKEAGGGYSSGKKKNQKNLDKWNKEDWQYSDGKKSGGKGRYRPAKVWNKLSQKEKDSLNQSKYNGNKKGKQFVSIPKKLKDKVQPSKFALAPYRTINFTVEHAGETFAGINKPKRTPNHPTKSHAVLINDNGKKRIVRFGQQGVKGSPKKKGESESYAKRRKSFKSRHGIGKKKLSKSSALYWSNRVKW